jgi:hypothetical protein
LGRNRIEAPIIDNIAPVTARSKIGGRLVDRRGVDNRA